MAIRKNCLFWVMILIAAVLLSLCACAEQKDLRNIEDCYHIRTNNDFTFAYEISDFKGNVLISESAAVNEPTIKPLSTSVLEVLTQTGTGLSANWAIFCDLEAGKISEKFYYVLGAKDGYVLYVKYEDMVHSIICQNIFDPEALTQEYIVDDELVILDSFSKADFETEGVAKISYLTGDTAITQKYITIYFPS